VKPGVGSLIIVFLWSIFMGVTAVSIGFGALFPSMNRIAKPFVCANGELVVNETVLHPYPGRVSKIVRWTCVDRASGVAEPLSPFLLSLYAGPFYGLLIFAAVAVPWYRMMQRKAALATASGSRIALRGPTGASDVESRMKKLGQLRADDLITEDEYQRKRSEILDEL